MLEPSEILDKYIDVDETIQISIEELDIDNEGKVELMELSEMKEEYRDIYILISENLTLNEISKELDISLTDLYQRIFLMEIEGIIENRNNTYKICKKGKNKK